MAPFAGFPAGKVRFTRIPSPFFTELLPEIDHLGELKLTLFAIWHAEQGGDVVRYLTFADFSQDERLAAGFGRTPAEAQAALQDALDRAVQRGSLLRCLPVGGSASDAIYFVNTPRGRAAAQALAAGKWSPAAGERPPLTLEMERPTIFQIYEKNIGALTPMIADALKIAELEYPLEWIEDAVRIAVLNNVRRWRYVEAILRSWKEKGRDETDRRNLEEDRRKYIQGEFARYIEH